MPEPDNLTNEAEKKEKSAGGGQQAAQPGGLSNLFRGCSNFFRALGYVHEASGADNVKQRLSDYISIILVIICILSMVFAVMVPLPVHLRLLPLLFTVAAVFIYIVNRLGIVISLTPRQTLIVWQLLVAGFWLGVTTAMLIMLICIYFLARSY